MGGKLGVGEVRGRGVVSGGDGQKGRGGVRKRSS